MNLKICALLFFALAFSNSALAGLGSTSSEVSGSTSASTKKLFSQNDKERVEQFVEQNFDRLQEQAARGSGTLLNDYVRLMGCQNSQDSMNKAIQKNYSHLFNNGKSELLPRTEQLIQQDSALVQACDTRT